MEAESSRPASGRWTTRDAVCALVVAAASAAIYAMGVIA